MSVREKATPRPWQALEDSVSKKYFITSNVSTGSDPFGMDICYDIADKANAELIVKAVNNYDLLVALLDKALPYLKDNPALFQNTKQALQSVRGE